MSNYRYEIKFSLEDLGFSGVMQWILLGTKLRKRYPDRYVNSIYFDDLNYTSVKDNLIGISNRRKYRIRWYGRNNLIAAPSQVQFEVKIRKGRLGKKIIYPLHYSERDLISLPIDKIELILGKELTDVDSQPNDYYRAVLGVQYLREYFEDSNGLRITIDKEIKFKDLNGCKSSLEKCPSVAHNKYIMEIKFDVELKEYVAKLTQNLCISPLRHSKYLMGLARFGYASYI